MLELFVQLFKAVLQLFLALLNLRASAHPAERFYVIGRSYDIKKPDLLIGKSGSIIRVASCQGKCNRLCLRRRFPV